MFQLIRRLYSPHRRLVVALLLSALGLSFDGIVQPYVIGHFTDAMAAHQLKQGLTLLGGWAIALVFLVSFNYAYNYCVGQNRRALNLDLRMLVAQHALAPSNATQSSSQFTAVIFNDIKQIESAFVDSLGMIVFCSLQALLTFAFILATNWRLGLLFVSFGLLPSLVPKFTGAWLQRGTIAWQTANQRYTDQLEETLNARPLARTYQLDSTLLDRLHHSLARSEHRYFAMNLRQSGASTLVQLLYDVAFLVPLAIGAWLVFHGQLTIGALLTLNSAADRVTAPLVSIAQYYNRLTAARPLLDQVLTAPVAPQPYPLAPVGPPTQLTWTHVTVGYDHPLTPPLDLTITQGAHWLIQGPSGSGKSTLLQTLADTLPPLSGTRAHATRWAEQIALVAQTPFLFHDTLRFNLALGRPVTDADLQAALVQVGLPHLVDQLALVLGATARPLSGGELKRLEVARALLTHRPILLVDEGLSGLDPHTAAQLQAVFQRFSGTLIQVEHHIDPAALATYDHVLTLQPL
ncbi:ABC transporter transmembrane domain-containing protein [Lacticaseibacillus absianus]|uniref:ABC transporter transmembrane domain-containing protein n=1 Tax=Lacticaseibacillus absianus TaxID=2729623 RepID=UPI0015CA832A|nr:ABC transporter ATP-binding protein [Lacticaseibacillus absianus]